MPLGTITDTAFTGERKLRVLSLFAGIGGFDLGLERTGGFETVAFCEIDPFCRRVLAKHWPEVPCYDDVRSLTADRLAADGIAVDCIVGGFPCQDLSHAGKRGGLEAARSGLWSEYKRLIRELRPLVAVVENTPGLLSLGMGTVLGDLAALGYDAQWDCIPANRVGAPHERDRVWIVTYANEDGLQERVHVAGTGGETCCDQFAGCAADRVPASPQSSNTDARQRPLGRQAGRMGRIFQPVPWHRAWPIAAEPVLGRGADGIPDRLDRIGALGNAVVPQIPELIGNAILASLHDFTGKARPLQAGERGQTVPIPFGLAPSSYQSREDRACGLGASSVSLLHSNPNNLGSQPDHG